MADVHGRKIKKQTRVAHCVAVCQDCGAEFGTYKNAQGNAAKHAKRYGHLVKCEVLIESIYNGRPDEHY